MVNFSESVCDLQNGITGYSPKFQHGLIGFLTRSMNRITECSVVAERPSAKISPCPIADREDRAIFAIVKSSVRQD
jgi:hypothetical protein